MSDPNTWAKATVKNNWGSQISDVFLYHRYDDDHYDHGHWDFIDSGTQAPNPFAVGYWTGFMRNGKDYWLVQFTADGHTWTCKPNFYCYLTADDKNGLVVCSVEKGNQSMKVAPPSSSSCTVSLYQISRSAEQVAARQAGGR